jgi:riboflavin synthase
MFTGIITHLGRIRAIAHRGNGLELEVESDLLGGKPELGASVAHSGVCLTVTDHLPGGWRVFASAETLALTTLGRWQVGDRINLEASLRLGDELGGHLVFGHVDGVGTIRAIEPQGESRRFEFALPDGLAPLVARKGSISVDGISLTVNEAAADSFAVTIIPHTMAHTTLGNRREGDNVNLEADMLARYVARQLALAQPPE